MEFRYDYYSDLNFQEMLNVFVGKIFEDFSFTSWNELEIKQNLYTPFSFFEKDKIIANVSASPMTLVIEGQKVDAVQIGTVGTLPEFRNLGLIKRLMEKVFQHWDKTRSLYFLFANKSTQNFYQHFGFRPALEYHFTSPAPSFTPSSVPARRLDVTLSHDREILFRLAKDRVPVSQILGVMNNGWLLAFHAAIILSQHFVYIESLDTIVISKIDGPVVHLIDIVGKQIPSFEEIYPYIGSKGVETIKLHFPPDRIEMKNVTAHPDDDSELFVKGPFPIENKPFRFPVTWQA